MEAAFKHFENSMKICDKLFHDQNQLKNCFILFILYLIIYAYDYIVNVFFLLLYLKSRL